MKEEETKEESQGRRAPAEGGGGDGDVLLADCFEVVYPLRGEEIVVRNKPARGSGSQTQETEEDSPGRAGAPPENPGGTEAEKRKREDEVKEEESEEGGEDETMVRELGTEAAERLVDELASLPLMFRQSSGE